MYAWDRDTVKPLAAVSYALCLIELLEQCGQQDVVSRAFLRRIRVELGFDGRDLLRLLINEKIAVHGEVGMRMRVKGVVETSPAIVAQGRPLCEQRGHATPTSTTLT